jgi:hypothetical protein
MKVRIVCYEDVNTWILGKFALKLQEYLLKEGADVKVGYETDLSADINHHIIYAGFNGKPTTMDTLMVTHIDNIAKLRLLRQMLTVSQMAICMSRESMKYLANSDLPREKLCFINPAHDGIIKPRPYIIGITCRVQEDGRKREYMLGELASRLDPSYFAFKIMGDGWDKYVKLLKEKGFEVIYWNNFIYNEYIKLIPTLDYYLYMGQDEGQMGFIDAVAAGVETIVTPQGYHLDVKDGISYAFNTVEELLSIFKSIYQKRKKYINSVSSWSWRSYALKHFAVWEYLLAKKYNKKYFLPSNLEYYDGIHSIQEYDTEINVKMNWAEIIAFKMTLTLNWFRHKYYLKFKSKF